VTHRYGDPYDPAVPDEERRAALVAEMARRHPGGIEVPSARGRPLYTRQGRDLSYLVAAGVATWRRVRPGPRQPARVVYVLATPPQ
jgi:hypothetical protein